MNAYRAHSELLARRAAEQATETQVAENAQRRSRRKRTVAVVTGSALFSVAFVAPTALLPFAETSPMLVTVGVAVPTGLGFAVWQWINYVATREDLRVVRQVQPEPELKADLR